MADKKGYSGKITQAGVQVIKAPLAKSGKNGKTVVKEGNDLRVKK